MRDVTHRVGMAHGRLTVAVDDATCIVLLDSSGSDVVRVHTVTDVGRLVADLTTAREIAQMARAS